MLTLFGRESEFLGYIFCECFQMAVEGVKIRTHLGKQRRAVLGGWLVPPTSPMAHRYVKDQTFLASRVLNYQ